MIVCAVMLVVCSASCVKEVPTSVVNGPSFGEKANISVNDEGCLYISVPVSVPADFRYSSCGIRVEGAESRDFESSVKNGAISIQLDAFDYSGQHIKVCAFFSNGAGNEFVSSKTSFDVAFRELTFLAESPSSIALNKIGSPSLVTLEYHLKGGKWMAYTIGQNIQLADGETVSFRAGQSGNQTLCRSLDDYYQFAMTGKIKASGNIMSLLDYSMKKDYVQDYAFSKLFKDCAGLIMAPELPAVSLSDNCYYAMFEGCAGLVEAPALPATKLASYCYDSMFKGCTNLTTAPILPAEYLADRCYFSMFEGCERLTAAPQLLAKIMKNQCYHSMFKGCISLRTAPDLPATTLGSGCYSSMFYGCTSLIEAPLLPATELARSCYSTMFYRCTNLTSAPVLPAAKLDTWCYSNMFNGCSNLISAPQLAAIDLVEGCYYAMFSNCSKLNHVEMLALDISAQDCMANWLEDVSPTGTFVKSVEAKWNVRGASGIPDGWIVKFTIDKIWVIGAGESIGAWKFDTLEQCLYDYDNNGIYTGLIDYQSDASKGWKLTGVLYWSDDYTWGINGSVPAPSSESPSLDVISGSDSREIKIYGKRFYMWEFDIDALKLKMKYGFDNIGIAGTLNNWNAADPTMKMTYNATTHKFFLDVNLPSDTEIKFTCDDKWDLNFGDRCEQGGGNIVPKISGNVRIYLDLNKNEYEFSTANFDTREEGTVWSPSNLR